MGSTEINASDLKYRIKDVKAGDFIALTGTIYTARDAAHKKIFELLDRGEKLPFDITGSIIYYAGPTQAKVGQVIGSCGPTTSGRMDKFTPRLLSLGLTGMIGKGERDFSVIEAIKKYGAVYFAAIGGAGALISNSVKKAEVIAFEELGCESVKRLYVEKLPVICAIDSFGNDMYSAGRSEYAKAGKV